MARPTAFTRQTSFTQYSSNYPSKPQNGASLDAEFNAAKVALDETQSNLALIQDADGALARGSVGRAQFDSSVSLGFASPTPWAADTFYTAYLNTVWYQGKFYTAVEDHTSTATFDASKWFEVADLSASAAIADGSITDVKLATGAVTADKISSLAVTTLKIASAAVTNAKLASGAVTRSKVDNAAGPDLAALILPAGLGPLPWPFAGDAPTGWVFDGAEYNRADFPALAALAVADAANASSWFTTGDGSTTFTIKSAAGKVLAGLDSDGSVIGSVLALGATVGTKDKTLERANLPNVAPTFTGSVGTVDVDQDDGYSAVNPSSSTFVTAQTGGGVGGVVGGTPGTTVKAISSSGSFTPAGTVESINGGVAQTAVEIVQPTVGVRFIFKAH
jgi:hypothetical protein